MLLNVATVEQDASDGITITLLGRTPVGIPQVHHFKGQGLKSIDAIMLHLGIHVVAWLVDAEPWQSSIKEIDLPLVIKAGAAHGAALSDDRFGNAAVLAKLKPGEPFFVLRGQDKMAPMAVRHWANEAEKAGVDPAKVQNARNCAHAMMQHRPIKMPD